MSLVLYLSNIDNNHITPLHHLITNATHFRLLDLVTNPPTDAIMTTLSTIANHACHLTTLYLSLRYDENTIPIHFFHLRFPELRHLVRRGHCIAFGQWPLLRHFLEEDKQLKSLDVWLDALNEP